METAAGSAACPLLCSQSLLLTVFPGYIMERRHITGEVWGLERGPAGIPWPKCLVATSAQIGRPSYRFVGALSPVRRPGHVPVSFITWPQWPSSVIHFWDPAPPFWEQNQKDSFPPDPQETLQVIYLIAWSSPIHQCWVTPRTVLLCKEPRWARNLLNLFCKVPHWAMY